MLCLPVRKTVMEIKKNEKINGYTVELKIAVGKDEFEAALEKA